VPALTLKLGGMHDDDDPLDDGEVVRNCSSTTLETYVGLVEVSYCQGYALPLDRCWASVVRHFVSLHFIYTILYHTSYVSDATLLSRCKLVQTTFSYLMHVVHPNIIGSVYCARGELVLKELHYSKCYVSFNR
jgi:hypothetical protein